MNKPHKSFSLEEGKIQASILLKAFHSSDEKRVTHATKRFKRLPEFSEIIKQKVQLKHALAVIALENGFNSWNDLKTQINLIVGGFLNKWFTNYAEAKTHQQSAGGYLLPYKKHFFICDTNYIKQLGFDPNDADWQLISRDWVQPKDKIAWQRLYKKWMKIQQKGKRDGKHSE